MKKLFLLPLMALLFAVSAFAQHTYPYVLSPESFEANVDKYSTNPVVSISTPIIVKLADGVLGTHAIHVSVPPFTDINGNINSDMFSFSMNDGFNVYTDHDALVQPGGQTAITVKVDTSKLKTANGLGVGILVKDQDTNISRSVFITLNVIDGRVYAFPADNVRVVPHIATGKNWRTTLQFSNPNISNTQVRVDFFNQAGQPVALRTKDGTMLATQYVSVNAHGAGKLVIEDSTVPNTITATASIIPVFGYPLSVNIIYETTFAPHSAALPAPQVTSDTLTLTYDNTEGNTTGFVLLNSLNWPEPVVLTYYNEIGDLVLTKTVTLPANGQTATIENAPEIAGHSGTIHAVMPFKALTGFILKFDPNFFFIPVLPVLF